MHSIVHSPRATTAGCRPTRVACLVVASLFLGRSGASADERGHHRLRLELDGAYSLRDGDDGSRLGFGGALEYEYFFGPLVGLGVRYENVVFHDSVDYVGNGFGVYHGVGPELRLHLVRDVDRIDPWVAGGPRLGFTGDLVRFGLHASVGLDIRVSDAISVGPTVSYLHLVQPNDAQDGGADGRVLTFGVALTWGNPVGRDEDEAEPEPVPEDPDALGTTQTTSSADSDDGNDPSSRDTSSGEPSSDLPPVEGDPVSGEGETPQPATRVEPEDDGSLDEECPNEAVPGGCPPPRPIALRISDFDSESAALNDVQIEQLRLVLQRLRSNRRIRRVQVIGHADQSGAESYNVRLSERRAAAVVAWLVDHGVARSRLQIVARGSTEPLIRDGSEEQLGTNRRVEFVIVDPPSMMD